MPRLAKKLTSKQTRAIAIISTGHTIEHAASLVGVKPNAISQWMHNQLFREELDLTMERIRKTFESRVFSLANNSAPIIQKAMEATRFEIMDGKRVEVPDMDRRLEGAKIAMGAAVRLANRYKELQVEGFAPPPQPLVVFPEGTIMPWQNIQGQLPAQVIDVEAENGEGDPAGD